MKILIFDEEAEILNDALELKLKKYFGDMLVYKSSGNAKFFSTLSLPSFIFVAREIKRGLVKNENFNI